MKKEPSLVRRKADPKANQEQQDLSEPSIELEKEIVSENLAKLYLKQGKTDKAISIYEKLILKFPDKKSYFAASIEKLKNF